MYTPLHPCILPYPSPPSLSFPIHPYPSLSFPIYSYTSLFFHTLPIPPYSSISFPIHPYTSLSFSILPYLLHILPNPSLFLPTFPYNFSSRLHPILTFRFCLKAAN